MISGSRRLRVPALLLAAFAALLVFAAAASAETRTGESTTATAEGVPGPESTLVQATASYDTGGSAVFNLVTAAPPGEKSEFLAGLTTTSSCVAASNFEALLLPLVFSPPPLLLVEGGPKTGAVAIVGSLTAPQFAPASVSVSGVTTTISVNSGALANAGYNCAIIAALATTGEEGVEEEVPGGGGGLGSLGGGSGASFMAFPINAPPPPPPAPTPPAPPAPPAATTPPPVLSIGKVKPVSVKAGKSRSVRIKVTNSGGTGTGAGSVRVKAPKGVVVKPERQQIPALAPGKSWTVTVRVQLTAKAKKKSTLAVTAAASGLTASGSVAVKLK